MRTINLTYRNPSSWILFSLFFFLALNHPWIKSGGKISSDPENPRDLEAEAAGEEAVGTMITGLKTYREFSRLKKTALVAVAMGMADKDVNLIKIAFEELDQKKNGTISLDEFRTVMRKVCACRSSRACTVVFLFFLAVSYH